MNPEFANPCSNVGRFRQRGETNELCPDSTAYTAASGSMRTNLTPGAYPAGVSLFERHPPHFSTAAHIWAGRSMHRRPACGSLSVTAPLFALSDRLTQLGGSPFSGGTSSKPGFFSRFAAACAGWSAAATSQQAVKIRAHFQALTMWPRCPRNIRGWGIISFLLAAYERKRTCAHFLLQSFSIVGTLGHGTSISFQAFGL